MSLFKSRGKHASKSKSKTDAQSVAAADASVENDAVDEAVKIEVVEPIAPIEPVDADAGAVDNAAIDAETTTDAADASASKSEDASSGDVSEANTDATAPSDDASAQFLAAGFAELPKEKNRRRALKVLGIIFGVLVGLAAIAYVAIAVIFMGRFLPNTYIGERDVSLKTDAETIALLDEIVTGYKLHVSGGGFSYHTTSEEVGLSIDAPDSVAAMHTSLNPWAWPFLVLQGAHDEKDHLVVKYKPVLYTDNVKAAVGEFNKNAKDPVNATITYKGSKDEFVVKPEVLGTKLDADAVLDAMADAIVKLEPKAVIGEKQLIAPAVLSTDKQLIEAAQLATGLVSAKLTLLMGGKPACEIAGAQLSDFVAIGEDYQVVFKDDEMNAWLDSLFAGLNTVESERTYTRDDGKAITVKGGVYGWEVDSEALKTAVLEGIKAGHVSEIEVPCTQTAEVYEGAQQRDWGKRYIDVDISEQHVRFYDDKGVVFWETDCISGAPDGKHDTVEGVWTVNSKESPSKLTGYENGKKIYETKVKYWMPFEGNGIGFHDATWQPGFGGRMYANGYGSHGCVNLSYEDAETLYGIIQEGDVVVVHY